MDGRTGGNLFTQPENYVSSLDERFCGRESGYGKAVFLRHGESEWDIDNVFTGWKDVDLTEMGVEEARGAGRILAEENYSFDCAHTSALKRSVKTLDVVLEEMKLTGMPVNASWQLNERSYGALEGLDRGMHRVQRGIIIYARPRRLGGKGSARFEDFFIYPLNRGENLQEIADRTVPYWEKAIVPQIEEGKNVLVVAGSDSMRALVKHIEDVPYGRISSADVQAGVPLVYEFDGRGNPAEKYRLGG